LKIALLTSSRADYGIYLPLLKALKQDPFFKLHIIAFGTHLSPKYGETVNCIMDDGFEVSVKVDTMPDDDTPGSIAHAMGKTMTNFSRVWAEGNFDLIIALGDRFEMFAACAASVPFGIPVAHIHGGETTLGAIDDTFRHSITQMASYHFAAAEKYKERIIQLKGSAKHVYNTGALSVDNLASTTLQSIDSFREEFGIDLSVPGILITFHPETVDYHKNEKYVDELMAALSMIEGYQFIIMMPNADTTSNMIREKIQDFIAHNTHAFGVESFGSLAYLSCMKHCRMMLGNTSSGFIEAGFFPKYVINIGERQLGRIVTPNIHNCAIERNAIVKAVKDFKEGTVAEKISIYGSGKAAQQIVSILKKEFTDK
jgi:GDP/UDP-N,N'-diacetylbacillosamine 2-epimerase (hydrolysing)